MDCGDDWCYVDPENGSLRSPSFDEVEPDFELEPMVVEELVATPPKSVLFITRSHANSDGDAIDVLDLLSDSEVTSTAPSREMNLVLLTAAHRRYVLTGAKDDHVKAAPRKRTVREAFTNPSRRLHTEFTFADRLRSAVLSRRARSTVSSATVEQTFLTPLTRDQGVQTDAVTDEMTILSCSEYAASLSSALERSLRLAMQLKSKSRDVERSDLRTIHISQQLDDSRCENEQLQQQLLTAERALEISRKRSELSDQYQDHLKRELTQAHVDNNSLSQRLEVLAGGLDVDVKSIHELEHLEESLDRAMTTIRLALRAKYRAAITGIDVAIAVPVSTKRSKQVCVVCMEKLQCVRLEPCGHEVLCSGCALRVTACPVDRQAIQNKILTHGINEYTDVENQ